MLLKRVPVCQHAVESWALHVAHLNNETGLGRAPCAECRAALTERSPKALLREAHVGLRSAAPLKFAKRGQHETETRVLLGKHGSRLIDVPVSLWCFAKRATARLTL